MGVTPIKMPQLGESVTEGTVDKWLKQEGDLVKRDEPLVEVVTDKVNAEIPSPFEGKLTKISVQAGATVPIGTEIAQMEVEGAAVAVAAPASETAAPDQSRRPSPGEPSPSPSPAPEWPRYSPAVRRLAEEHGLDLAQIQGSGDGGRITRDDVLAFIERQDKPAAAARAPEPARAVPAAPTPSRAAADGREELVPLNAMRRSIAEHMVRSVSTTPHAWTLVEVDVTEVVRYREAEKEGFQRRNGAPLTYLPFVVQALCDALAEFPHLNSSWTDEGILLKHYINLGIAVAIPDGLIVPVIKDADQVGFTDLARKIADLAGRARSKRLKPEEVQGGTFTLNNTGANGSVASAPIINQPQAAILTTEAIVRRPIVIGDGIAIRHMMNMCLSFDHRILDGLTAGRFLAFIKDRLESWTPASIRM
jgi:2-oxoisovalerate dehydrogenase E2 component (dihydrolipoyl transacylase)